MENVSCAEAQVIFALSLLKKEKNVTLMTFTNEKWTLKPIAWTAETTIEQAMEAFDKEKCKTKENIKYPVNFASENSHEVDVFVTFVSSVARTWGKGTQAPLDALQKYKQAMNSKMTR